jgi:hypothetical protein
MANEQQLGPDEVRELIKEQRKEAASAFALFKKKVATGAIADLTALAYEMENLFSLVVDLGDQSLGLHLDNMDWSEDIESEIDALKAGVSSLLPSDAEALKTTLLALQRNLRASTGPEDNEPALLTQKVTETLAFIDAITMDEEGDDPDDELPDDDDEN